MDLVLYNIIVSIPKKNKKTSYEGNETSVSHRAHAPSGPVIVDPLGVSGGCQHSDACSHYVVVAGGGGCRVVVGQNGSSMVVVVSG
jgi:hypothetical protein